MNFAALQAENQALREQNELLRQELSELKRLIYGSKRERFVGSATPWQLSLLSDEELVAKAGVEKQIYQRAIAKSTASSTPPSRKLLPAHLPRVEVVLEPEADTSQMKKIGEQISEELDYEPAKLFVRRYVQARYVSEEEDFHMAPLPNRPIDNHSMTEASLAQGYSLRF